MKKPNKLQSGNFRESELVKLGGPWRWRRIPGVGDKVTLNSGGPMMLIVDVEGEIMVTSWIDDDGKPVECPFHYVMLRPWKSRNREWQRRSLNP